MGREARGACFNCQKGPVTWGADSKPAAAATLPGGLTMGQNLTADLLRPEGGKFCKNICSVWMVQIFSKPLA